MKRKTLTRNDLLSRYIRAAWIMKIRLMSCRLELSATLESAIHLERANLQLRKICENVAQMCAIAAELQELDLSKEIRNNYSATKMLSDLKNLGALRFSHNARLSRSRTFETGKHNHWNLDISEPDEDDVHFFRKAYVQCDSKLHETKYPDAWPADEVCSRKKLSNGYQEAARTHMWLWNRFWQHAFELRKTPVIVSLGDDTRTTRPMIIFEEGLAPIDLAVEFEPKYLADFEEPIVWRTASIVS